MAALRNLYVQWTSSLLVSDSPTQTQPGLYGILPYGPTWHHLRREFHINFLLTEMEAFRPFEQRAVHRLLRNLLSSPKDFPKHFRQ